MVIRLPKRCVGTTRNGRRCSIESTSNLCGEDGKQLAGPLRDGADCCRVHLDIFCASALATPDLEPPLLFFVDFEATGLSVTNNQIVEFGVISAHGTVFLHFVYVRPCRAKAWIVFPGEASRGQGTLDNEKNGEVRASLPRCVVSKQSM